MKIDSSVINKIIKSKLAQGQELTLEVSSNSMWPILKVGDHITVSDNQRKNYQVGDIVVYFHNSNFIVHRIKSLDFVNHIAVTKGDSSTKSDPKIPIDQILGKVTKFCRHSKYFKIQTGSSFILNIVSPYAGIVYMAISRSIRKLIDWVILGSPSSIRQQIGALIYILMINVIKIVFSFFKINGYVTRSAAVKDLVVARSDIDLIIVADNAEQIEFISSVAKTTSRFFPILSDPAILPPKLFNFWASYGGCLRLESRSWKHFGPRLPFPDIKRDTNSSLSVLNGCFEIYKKLWRQVVKLAIPNSMYHAANISNFQKYIIDAIRWINIAQGVSTIDAFNLKRLEYLDSIEDLILNENVDFAELIRFARGAPVMQSANRTEQAISYFICIATRLEATIVSYSIKNHLVIPETYLPNMHSNDRAVTEYFYICENLDSQTLHKFILDGNKDLLPFTANTLKHAFAAIPFVNARTRQDLGIDLFKSLFYRDLAEIIVFIAYSSNNFNFWGLQKAAIETIYAYYLYKYNLVVSDIDDIDSSLLSEFPAIETLIFSRHKSRLVTSVQKDVKHELIKILELVIRLEQ